MQRKIDKLVLQLENYLECWKQFNHFISLARTKEYTAEDENQFLEVKSILAQELELILCSFESGAPSKEDMHTVISSAPSIRFLSELSDGSLRGLENQWHKLYISWQSILGQLKAQQQATPPPSFWGRLFGKS